MHELLTTAQMAAADRRTIETGTAGIDLMERAGEAVARAVRDRAPPGSRIVVVCGPGNNGGDGFVAARLLAAVGFDVVVMLLGQQSALKGDAAEAAARWAGDVFPADPQRLAGAALIVDALFGAGLSRPVDGVARTLIEAVNAARVPVVAVDLPSGINGDTGAVMGAAVRASEAITFFRRKPGHLLLPGRAHCGAVTVTDIGIPSGVLAETGVTASVNEPALWRDGFPVLRVDGHKYARGHVVVVSGGLSSTGAARLAARGALRAGAGLVTIASPSGALAVNAASSLAVMVRPVDGADELGALLADRRFNAVVLGPGGGVGETMRGAQVSAALGGGRRVVLDADALTSFAGAAEALRDRLRAHDGEAVLTPHEGEFVRLFEGLPDILEAPSKLERTRRSAAFMGATILLKGPDTVVATAGGAAAISGNAPPWLATAGAGDVLAGMIAALMAQGMAGFDAANAAAWLHGEAAQAFGPGLISEDLPETLPQVLRRLRAPADG
jgi:ADP-dependent NAD(P)H-hydrate dehydratase / NAD(P)H-hydrate epimerase